MSGGGWKLQSNFQPPPTYFNMSYQTYTTDAIVCGNRVSNTADRVYRLFTRDYGMVWATARSVREEKSRQRFALQDFTFVRVSLVKGKTGWRIGSVEAVGNAYFSATTREVRQVVAQALNLVRRLIQGEEAVPEIFADLEQLWRQCLQGAHIPLVAAEYFTYRSLATLGYIDAHETVANDWLQETPPLSAAAKQAIEYGLAQSHL